MKKEELKYRIKELKKVIKDLRSCPVQSPFNPYYFRDFWVKENWGKYDTRLKTLERQLKKYE